MITDAALLKMPPPMPDAVLVGACEYRIVTDAAEIKRISDEADIESGSEWVAFSDHNALIIGINPEFSEQANRVSVLHEVLHCCLRASGVWPDQYSRVVAKAKGRHGGYSVEEATVQGIDNTLVRVLRDNPALVEWLVS